ncbi:hypothetical protein EGJ05_05000 [Stutzerimonas xanthomarina]|nr:hypothetical protein EGJ05_05000 [Stutzerimonas xanthomarina]
MSVTRGASMMRCVVVNTWPKISR